ncbi:hypothetical protein DXG01_001264, partial [Tephrocybe rancida]
MASISLTLDDEVQYRCAGYIQAEIERYADTLDVAGDDDEHGQDRSGDESGDDQPADGANGKAKPSKGKKPEIE